MPIVLNRESEKESEKHEKGNGRWRQRMRREKIFPCNPIESLKSIFSGEHGGDYSARAVRRSLC